MERLSIPNLATYLPLAPADVLLTAPIAARVLFYATPIGRLLPMAFLGFYAGSAALDWLQRSAMRRIDFARHFGVAPLSPPAATREERQDDVRQLVGQLNPLYQPLDLPQAALAVRVDQHLTDYIATITGQRVETSQQVRRFMLAHLLFPFALGATDPLTGDIAIFKSLGVLDPHVMAHEFCHRKGYFKEVEAQLLAYLALVASGETALVQAALCERLACQLWLLAGREVVAYHALTASLPLREELKRVILSRHGRPPRSSGRNRLSLMQRAYEARMRLSGQNGLSDYDEGFTNVLLALERMPPGGGPCLSDRVAAEEPLKPTTRGGSGVVFPMDQH